MTRVLGKFFPKTLNPGLIFEKKSEKVTLHIIHTIPDRYFQGLEKQGKIEKLSQSRGDEGDMETKCNVAFSLVPEMEQRC